MRREWSTHWDFFSVLKGKSLLLFFKSQKEKKCKRIFYWFFFSESDETTTTQKKKRREERRVYKRIFFLMLLLLVRLSSFFLQVILFFFNNTCLYASIWDIPGVHPFTTSKVLKLKNPTRQRYSQLYYTNEPTTSRVLFRKRERERKNRIVLYLASFFILFWHKYYASLWRKEKKLVDWILLLGCIFFFILKLSNRKW